MAERESRKILIFDDDPHLLSYMEEVLRLEKFEVKAFQSPAEGLDFLKDNPADLIISDVKMNEMTGDEVLSHVMKNYPGTGVILVTGFGSIAHTVNAMRKGAFDYMTKPFSGKEFVSRINQFFKQRNQGMPAPVAEVSDLKTGPGAESKIRKKQKAEQAKTRLVGEDPKIQELLAALRQIAPTNAPVMIQGDSGTGKEVFARLIHENSDRSDKPYIRINCANLPSELVESTLFGHVKGAFTGAIEDKEGAFDHADGGTLLLDEVTEIDINIQAKLLRVLQEKEFQRVGSQKPKKVDVRIISTTNREMSESISEGIFRKDLYFRLNVFPITMPTLSERREDIPLLADYFCEKYAEEYGMEGKKISKDLHKHLLTKKWSGNVRELENYIQRGVIMSNQDAEIRIEHVESTLFSNVDEDLQSEVITDLPLLPIEEMELQMIKKALERTNGNQKEAAKLLKISDRTIRNKLKKLNFPDLHDED
jgi:DNA-binding NtrC family response regulator